MRGVASVCFVGRHVAALEDRARGLAAGFPPGLAAVHEFRGRPGWAGGAGAFVRTLGAARRHGAVWLLSQHPTRVLAAWVGRTVFGTPFVVDTGDLLEASVRTGGGSRIFCALVGWWEGVSLRLPDAVVVRGSAHVPIARARGARRVLLVRDGVDVAAFARRDAAALRARLGLGAAPTVGVVATISWEAHLGLPSPGWDIVACVDRLRDLDVRGIVVGDGPGLARLRDLARRRGVEDRIAWVGRVPLTDLPDYLSAMDVFVHTALNNPMSAVRTTGKLPLLLAAGCAAVVSRVGEAAAALEGTGLLLDFPGTPDEYAGDLAARVRTLVSEHQLERWRIEGPALAARLFGYDVVAREAVALVASLGVGAP